VNDEKVPSDDTTPDLEPTLEPTPAPAAAASDETVEIPAASQTPKSSKFSRPRQLLAAGGAGLLIVGGLAGFGIGRATGGGDDGPRFARTGQFGPGQGTPGQRGYGGQGQRGPGGGGFGGQRNAPPNSGQDNPPDGQSGGQPPATGSDGSSSDGT
jgi:hypothetical protein